MTEDLELLRELAPRAEEAVIGAMLIDPRCVGDVLTVLRPRDLRAPRLRALFEATRDLYNAREPVDAVTVLHKAGGDALAPVVRECMDLTPTAANVLDYCAIVRDQTALARLRDAGQELEDAPSLEAARDIVAGAQGILADKTGVTTVSLAASMADFMRRMTQPKPDYLHWGLGILDSMLHTGPGSYVIIAARPSTGKTALALQLALSIAKTKRVGFYSLETVPEILADRIAAQQLELDLPDIKERRLTASDMQALAARMAKSEALRGSLDLISAASMTVDDVRTTALARRHEVVVIDYVQLLRPTIRGERTAQMQQVSMDLRAAAQMTGLVIVALAQLRRPETGQKQKAATMADLKESGQFEQDADSILLMYHDVAENKDSDRWIKIEKNKEGYAGFRGRFRFNGRRQTFTAVDRDGQSLPVRANLEEDPQIGMEELPDGW